MGRSNRKKGSVNWDSLKTQINNTESGPKLQNTSEIRKLSKKKRKDIRQKIFQEAARLIGKSENSDDTKALLDNIEDTTTIMKPIASGIVALDCEYVGVGFNGSEDQVARVAIVNEHGKTIYDKYVKPLEEVTDYRTHVSGIQRGHLVKGVSFAQVQTEVGHLIQNKIVVGHALHNDFRVLKLSHPFRLVRDTSKYKPFRTLVGSYGAPTLKLLAERILGIRIQTGEHNPITDAKTALRLYMLHKKKWEVEIKKNKPRRYK